MELTVRTNRNNPAFASDYARASNNMTPTIPAEVAYFCERLTGLRGETYEDICDEVMDVPFPSGFLHVRVFDAADGDEISSVTSMNKRLPTTEGVSMLVTLQERFEENRWVETTALPVRDKGVLEQRAFNRTHIRQR